MLLEREAAGLAVRGGLLRVGEFGAIFMSQAGTTAGLQVIAVADLDLARARRHLQDAGWDADAICGSPAEALASGRIAVTQDVRSLIGFPEIEVVIEATGIASAGIGHALDAIAHGKHIV